MKGEIGLGIVLVVTALIYIHRTLAKLNNNLVDLGAMVERHVQGMNPEYIAARDNYIAAKDKESKELADEIRARGERRNDKL